MYMHTQTYSLAQVLLGSRVAPVDVEYEEARVRNSLDRISDENVQSAFNRIDTYFDSRATSSMVAFTDRGSSSSSRYVCIFMFCLLYMYVGLCRFMFVCLFVFICLFVCLFVCLFTK